MKFLAAHRRWSFVKPLWHFSPEIGAARQQYGFEASVTFDYPITIGTGSIRIWTGDFETQLAVISISDPRVTVSSNAITFEWTDTEFGVQEWVIEQTYGVTIDSGAVTFRGQPWGLTSDDGWVFSIAQPPGLAITSYSPALDATGIELNPTLTIGIGSALAGDSLSEGIEAGTGDFVLWRCEAGFPVSEVRRFAATDSRITFGAGWVGIDWGPVTLLYDTKYSVAIEPDAIRDSRYPDWSTIFSLDNQTWFFRTIPEPGPVELVSLTPANGATVPASYLNEGEFEIVLSEACSGNATLYLNGVDAGILSFSSTTGGTFSLGYIGTPGTTYTLIIGGSAIRSDATGALWDGDIGAWSITTSV